MKELVNVKTFLSKDEAELAKGFLSANGIRATILSDDLGGYRPHLTFGMKGIQLQVKQSDFQKAQELLESSVNDTTDANEDKESPEEALIYAIKANAFDVVEFLIGKGVDINAKDDNGKTALECARLNENEEIMKLLKENGAEEVVR